MPNPERWRLLEDLFQATCDLTGNERKAFLDRACGSDTAIRAEVESLLASDDRTAGFIQQSVSDTARDVSRSFAFRGKRIGPYELCDLIGQGGMGQVYLARRADNAYSQQVALKFIRADFAVDQEMLLRFRVERQILANLNHPNVARLLDGGITPEGLPWLALEYVEGVPIDEYCRRHCLPLRARLELFLTVCSAIEYAHRNLVIHRDIKPANVLVTAEGVPKLLDFGIAKLLSTDLVDSVGTRASVRLMTPEYASPEQVRGEPVTTATDVYAMGVLLYELLTGQRPFRVKTDSPLEIARVSPFSIKDLNPCDLERLICTENAPRPSDAPGLPRRRAKELSGDLDNIVLMAIRKEPARRYSSAGQFSEDLSRYLEGQPVIARKDTAFYRTGKFIQRHKTLVGTTTALLAALVCGTITTEWQAHKAQHRVNELQTVVDSVILTTNDDIANLPQSTELRAAMLKSTLDNLDKLTKDSDIAPHLLIQIAHAYERVAEIQGGPSTANLGQPDAAVSSLAKALHIAQQVAQHDSSNPEAMRLLIRTHYELGQMQRFVGKTDEAQEHIMTALRLARPYQAAAPSDEDRRQFLAGTLTGVADLQLASQQAKEALANYREALAVLDSAEFRGRSAKTLQTVGTIHNSIGLALMETGPLSAALEALRNAAEIRERLIREYPANLTYQRNLLITNLRIGNVLAGTEFASMGDAASAAVYIARARSLAERLAQLDSGNAQAKSDLVAAYARTGEVESYSHLGAAIDWFRKSLAIAQELGRSAPGSASYREQLATASWRLADVLARSGRRKEALAYAQAATKDLVDLLRLQPARSDFRPQLMMAHCLLCDLQHQSRNRAATLASQRAAMDLVASVSAGQEDLYSDYSLAQCYDVFSRTDEKNSEEWRQKSRELWSRLEENGVPAKK